VYVGGDHSVADATKGDGKSFLFGSNGFFSAFAFRGVFDDGYGASSLTDPSLQVTRYSLPTISRPSVNAFWTRSV
jgi:hypothetical protein